MKKIDLPTLLLILVFIVGLSLLLYPVISDRWNEWNQSKVIAGYMEAVEQLDSERYQAIWEQADAYNMALAQSGNVWTLSEEQTTEYEKQLNISDSGVISYVEIPRLDTQLPVYLGTDEAVLQVAVGHLEGSSLPTGGESTHCVLSSHRGLPSAKLFSELDRLEAGDVFYLHTMNETLVYEVDQILIVLPHEMEALRIVEGKDLCTLVTCTPYGVNSHRLLVRGHRIHPERPAQPDQPDTPVHIQAGATRTDPKLVALIFAVVQLLTIRIFYFLKRSKNTGSENK